MAPFDAVSPSRGMPASGRHRTPFLARTVALGPCGPGLAASLPGRLAALLGSAWRPTPPLGRPLNPADAFGDCNSQATALRARGRRKRRSCLPRKRSGPVRRASVTVLPLP